MRPSVSLGVRSAPWARSSSTIAALEAEGLVTRSTDTADKRVTRVRATPKGRRLMERGRDRRTRRLAAQLGDLAPDDLATLERAVSIVEGLIEAPGTGGRAATDGRRAVT